MTDRNRPRQAGTSRNELRQPATDRDTLIQTDIDQHRHSQTRTLTARDTPRQIEADQDDILKQFRQRPEQIKIYRDRDGDIRAHAETGRTLIQTDADRYR